MISGNNQVTESYRRTFPNLSIAKICWLVVLCIRWSIEHDILTFWVSDQQNNDRIPNPVALMVPDVCTVTLLARLKLMTVPCTRPEISISSTRHICKVKDNEEFKLQSSGGRKISIGQLSSSQFSFGALVLSTKSY